MSTAAFPAKSGDVHHRLLGISVAPEPYTQPESLMPRQDPTRPESRDSDPTPRLYKGPESESTTADPATLLVTAEWSGNVNALVQRKVYTVCNGIRSGSQSPGNYPDSPIATIAAPLYKI